MNIPYLIPRIARHFMPEDAVRFLLRRGMVIRPGLETTDPKSAVDRYLETFEQVGYSISGKRVLVFGYGGSYAVGCGLLASGAGHVILVDPYAPPDDRRNEALWPRYEAYLQQEAGRIVPRPESITLINADIRDAQVQDSVGTVDLVLSSSVYEHVDDVNGITRALAAATSQDGLQIHFVDLRDHFFKYPFEMLAYSDTTWQRWLNPSSNHNRFRYNDYRQAFEAGFDEVDIRVLSRDLEGFEQARPRLRAEFLTGDPQIDSITSIQILAREPHKGAQ